MAQIAINGKFLGATLNGVHRTAAHFSHELIGRAAAHHQVRLLGPDGQARNPDFPELVPVEVSGCFGKGQGWEMITLPRAAKDALLVNFCNLAPLLHSNSVVMIHDAQTYLFPEDYTGKQATFYRLALPLIGKRARHILTVSEFSRQSLARRGVGSLDKISVVHNGTDHILATAPDEAVLARNGLRPGGFVMTLGSAKGYKNMRAVFAAMHEPLDAGMPLVVAGGPGAQAYRAKGWEPPGNAIFTGFVSDAQLRALYANAALFMFPSLTEGFGLPPVEALHCGCPVISARAGAMPEVLGDAAILVEADDPAAYRQAANAVLDDPALREKLVAAGYVRAAELTWKKAGDRLWSQIAPLLSV